jgi:hypothetical protein
MARPGRQGDTWHCPVCRGREEDKKQGVQEQQQGAERSGSNQLLVPAQYLPIQGAIDHASTQTTGGPGDEGKVVVVSAGVYEESVQIRNKAISLVAAAEDEGKVMVQSITFSGADGRGLVKGIVIESGGADGRGLVIEEGAHVTVNNSVVRYCAAAGVIIDGAEATAALDRSTIHSNGADGVAVQNDARIDLTSDNVHSNDGNGVSIGEGGDAFVRDNSICSSAKSGIVVADGGTAQLEVNAIHSNKEHGIDISGKSSTGMSRALVAHENSTSNNSGGGIRVAPECEKSSNVGLNLSKTNGEYDHMGENRTPEWTATFAAQCANPSWKAKKMSTAEHGARRNASGEDDLCEDDVKNWPPNKRTPTKPKIAANFRNLPSQVQLTMLHSMPPPLPHWCLSSFSYSGKRRRGAKYERIVRKTR